MSIELRDKKFGILAVEKGFINKDKLFEALKIQVEEGLSGESHNFIGHILIRLAYLTPEQVDQILLAMRAK
jgi:hypothetical protein